MQASPQASGKVFLALAALLGMLAPGAPSQPTAHEAHEAREARDSVQPKVQRGFRTFLPKPGETIDDASSQVVQVLLDRQDKGQFDSYMVQVLFRGKPAARVVRMLPDRIEIDFLDTGKPSMRLAKIRGGAVEASSLDEFFYHDGTDHPRIKHLVRLTLFMQARTELKFRDTLDRSLIIFRLAKGNSPGK